ncbi:hypothetical protein [Paenibacillus glycanilyticus]|uniref:hypothetical protein n=1 Tax=Paenibacillus glycanilyticus TaxID=126569 RepID=UPI003EB9788C
MAVVRAGLFLADVDGGVMAVMAVIAVVAVWSLRESNVLPIAVVPGFLRFKPRCG